MPNPLRIWQDFFNFETEHIVVGDPDKAYLGYHVIDGKIVDYYDSN